MIEQDATELITRVDAEGFEALLAAADHAAMSDEHRSVLTRSGALVGDELHPELGLTMSVVVAATCRVLVAVADAEDLAQHQLWAAPGAVTLASDEGQGLCALSALEPDFWAKALLDLVGLAPHRLRTRAAQDRVSVNSELLDALWAEDPDARQEGAVRCAELLPENDDFVADVAAGRWRAWWAEASWPGVAGDVSLRRVSVLDCAAGIHLVVEGGLEPTTSLDVWLLLLQMLPRDDELYPRLRPGAVDQDGVLR